MPVFTLQTTIFCRGIVSSNGEGAHRCHSAVSSFIVPDLQSVNVTAALLHSPCQIIPSPQRAAPAASSYTFPLSVKSNAPFDNSRKSATSPRRVRPERIGSPPPSFGGVTSEERLCVSVGRVCKPLHPCHLFHSEGERGGRSMLMWHYPGCPRWQSHIQTKVNNLLLMKLCFFFQA